MVREHGAKVNFQKCFHLSSFALGGCENAIAGVFFYSTCPPLHSIIPIHVSAFRDPISDLVVTADYNLIELLYNFLRNGFQPDRNKISNEMKLRLMSGKGKT